VNKIIVFLFLINSLLVNSQINNFVLKFNLTPQVKETSGLLYFNDKLITINDSGNLPRLYEMDAISNTIIRTIDVLNVTNVDWEALAQDQQYIYIGDFGNNNGTRTDLKIYRIAKSDYLTNNQVNCEIIYFNYADQTDFSSNSNTNFDAEAMIVKDDNIIIFTKNHGDLKCNLYALPKMPGNYTAVQYGSFNTQGMITGATFNDMSGLILLTGYNSFVSPFIISLDSYSDNKFFDGNVNKTSILHLGRQVESITHTGNRYFISSESFNFGDYNFDAALFAFNFKNENTLVANKASEFNVSYPSNSYFTIDFKENKCVFLQIYDSLMRIVKNKIFNSFDKGQKK